MIEVHIVSWNRIFFKFNLDTVNLIKISFTFLNEPYSVSNLTIDHIQPRRFSDDAVLKALKLLRRHQ